MTSVVMYVTRSGPRRVTGQEVGPAAATPATGRGQAPDDQQLRASDADRDRALAELSEHFQAPGGKCLVAASTRPTLRIARRPAIGL
jgi:hypothetical protein